MSGTVIRALPKMFYDFYNGGNALANVGESVQIVLATGISVYEYREVDLVVRIHSFNVGNTAATFAVNAYPEVPTSEDPASDFWSSTPAVGTGTISFAGLTAPYLTLATLNIFATPAWGAFLRLKLTATQSNPISNPFNFAMSIDVNAKSL